tara:strand:+ start:16 stop:543 length:528 start_codon:yes stop_codon:yes gene_type:complete
MSSILKVDQLKDSGGNAIITSDGAGNLTAGTIPAKTIGTGAVLQVVFNSYSTEVSSTSSSIIASGLEATITPSSASSKIFVTASQSISKNNNSGAYGDFYIYRDSTALIRQHRNATFTNTSDYNYITAPFIYLDSPNTTSAVTYSTRFNNIGGYGYIYANTDDSVSTMVLMEIAG